MQERKQNPWHAFTQFDITVPCSATYFLEVGAAVSLKLAIKRTRRCKKTVQIVTFRNFSNVKMEECDKEVWNVFNQFDIIKTCSSTYRPQVGARVSLKVATKGSPRGKKNFEKLDF